MCTHVQFGIYPLYNILDEYQVSSAGIGHIVLTFLESGSDMASIPGAPVVYLMGHGGESSSHLV